MTPKKKKLNIDVRPSQGKQRRGMLAAQVAMNTTIAAATGGLVVFVLRMIMLKILGGVLISDLWLWPLTQHCFVKMFQTYIYIRTHTCIYLYINNSFAYLEKQEVTVGAFNLYRPLGKKTAI